MVYFLSMRKKAQEDIEGERIDLANNSSNPETLAELAKDKSRYVRGSVAYNKNTPPETLAELVKDKIPFVRFNAVNNTSTPPETLAELSKDEGIDIRGSVAFNPSTPTEILIELAKDKYWSVREGVAANTSTPSETLVELAKDEDEGVRSCVAYNPSTPIEILIELAKDKDLEVRESVASNPSTPILVRKKLKEHEEENFKVTEEEIETSLRQTFKNVGLDVKFESEESVERSPYATLLNKYSPDEIFDIASGRKEATEEEVALAKDVITRGIVSSRLSMRKKAQEYVYNEEDLESLNVGTNAYDFGGADLPQWEGITVVDTMSEKEFREFDYSDPYIEKDIGLPLDLEPRLYINVSKVMRYAGDTPERLQQIAINIDNALSPEGKVSLFDWKDKIVPVMNYLIGLGYKIETLEEEVNPPHEDDPAGEAHEDWYVMLQKSNKIIVQTKLNMRKKSYIVYDDKGRKFEVSL